MKFIKEIIIFSLIIFMLMSVVSANENITTTEDVNSTSTYIELEHVENSNEINNTNVPISVAGCGDKTFSGEVCGQGNFDSDDTFAFSSMEHYDVDTVANEYSSDKIFSNPSLTDNVFNHLYNNYFSSNFDVEDFITETESNYRKYLDHSRFDLFINENIKNKYYSYFQIIDFKKINLIEANLIKFMFTGVKHVDIQIMNLEFMEKHFLNIFNNIMNFACAHNTMTNISLSYNNPTLRNDKYNSNFTDSSFYQEIDSNINCYEVDDLSNQMNNTSDTMIIENNMLVNQIFDLKSMSDVCNDSYDNIGHDLQLSDECITDNENDVIVVVYIDNYHQINGFSNNACRYMQHSFNIIGCECTNTSFTKHLVVNDSFFNVNDIDNTTTNNQDDTPDYFLFKKYNVNAPFIVGNTSILSLFGVIKITIP